MLQSYGKTYAKVESNFSNAVPFFSESVVYHCVYKATDPSISFQYTLAVLLSQDVHFSSLSKHSLLGPITVCSVNAVKYASVRTASRPNAMRPKENNDSMSERYNLNG